MERGDGTDFIVEVWINRGESGVNASVSGEKNAATVKRKMDVGLNDTIVLDVVRYGILFRLALSL